MQHRHPLPAGTVIADQYKIEQVLRQGGFGITYLAEDIGLKTTVVLKEYFPLELATRSEKEPRICPKLELAQGDPADPTIAELYQFYLGRFVQEARILAQCSHPNIVRVSRVIENVNGTAYMALDYLRGEPLSQWLRMHGRTLNQVEVDSIAGPLLDALTYIHTRPQPILHRDIAPDNIMMVDGMRPVLIDFGAARLEMSRHTAMTSGAYKLGYSPIEQQSRQSSLHGPWTDIYAMAATLRFVVVGTRAPDSLERNLKDEMPRAVDLGLTGFRPGFLAALDAGMAVRHEDRPQTAREFKRMLGLDQPLSGVASAADELTERMPGAGGPQAIGRQDAIASAPPIGVNTARPDLQGGWSQIPSAPIPEMPKRRRAGRIAAGIFALGITGASFVAYHENWFQTSSRTSSARVVEPKTPQDPLALADDQAIAAARSANTVDSFKLYLDAVTRHGYPGRYVAEARDSINDIANFEDALKGTLAALEAYRKNSRLKLKDKEAEAEIAARTKAARREQCTAFVSDALKVIAEARAVEGCKIGGTPWDQVPEGHLALCLGDGAKAEAERQQRADTLAQCRRDADEKAAWTNLQSVLAQVAARPPAPVVNSAAPHELVQLREKLKVLKEQIDKIEAFLAANPNGVHGNFVQAARDQVTRYVAATEELRSKILALDRAKWAEAREIEAKTKSPDGYKSYADIFPDGEHPKAEVDGLITDLRACATIRAADDVSAMKAYQKKYADPKGRCWDEFARLIAPPTDLTGAKLIVRNLEEERRQVVEAEYAANNDPKKGPRPLFQAPPKIIGMVFATDGKRLTLIRDYDKGPATSFNLLTGAREADRRHVVHQLAYADLKIPDLDTAMDQDMRYRQRGVLYGLQDRIGGIWKGVFGSRVFREDQVRRAFTHGNSSFSWFDNGAIHVQEADSTAILRSFPVKEKDAVVPRIAMSSDGRTLAALVEWFEERRIKDSDACAGKYDPPSGAVNPLTNAPARPYALCTITKQELRIFDIATGKLIGIEKPYQYEWRAPVGERTTAIGAVPLRNVAGQTIYREEAPITSFTIGRDGTRLIISYGASLGLVAMRDIRTQAGIAAGVLLERVHPPQAFFRTVQPSDFLELKEPTDILVDDRQSDGSVQRYCAATLAAFRSAPQSDRYVSIEANVAPTLTLRCVNVPAGFKPLSQAVSPDYRLLAAADSDTVYVWDIASGQSLATHKLLPGMNYVTITAGGMFNSSADAEPHLAVEIGKRRWPLADVPAFKDAFYRKDGINLLAAPAK